MGPPPTGALARVAARPVLPMSTVLPPPGPEPGQPGQRSTVLICSGSTATCLRCSSAQDKGQSIYTVFIRIHPDNLILRRPHISCHFRNPQYTFSLFPVMPQVSACVSPDPLRYRSSFFPSSSSSSFALAARYASPPSNPKIIPYHPIPASPLPQHDLAVCVFARRWGPTPRPP